MYLFIEKTIRHVILTVALIALTILIWYPSKINLLGIGCKTIVANPGEIPYHVSIQFNENHHCSGCLISRKHVLTAAFCVDNPIADSLPDPRMKVVIGTRKLPAGIVSNVAKVTRHSHYKRIVMNDNIAVVRLKEEVVESRYVKIINLPEPRQIIEDGQKLVVSAFDSSTLRGSSNYLKKITMKVVTKKSCENDFPYQAWFDTFCAVLDNRYANCQVENGSPAIVDKKYVIGIFSSHPFRLGCQRGAPRLFTYVPKYLDFIRKEMRD